MKKNNASLAEVSVTAKKPIVEVRADKTILNVEGTINAAGNDALELLRKSPGVMVDKDDNLSLAGKNGVQVFIDGKPSHNRLPQVSCKRFCRIGCSTGGKEFLLKFSFFFSVKYLR